MKRIIAILGAVTLGGSLTMFGVQGAFAAPPQPQKVTICHRTHSVTNPYRMITVSKSSLDGPLNPRNPSLPTQTSGNHAGYVHNGYDGNGVDQFPVADGYPNVFTPGTNYSNPKKKVWEDIIPPFTVSSTTGGLIAGSYAGMNWTTDGKAIYFGLGTVGGQAAYGLCKKMTAKEFAQSEKEAFEEAHEEDPEILDPDDNKTPEEIDEIIDDEIIDDLKDQDADEDDGIDLDNITDPDNLPDEVTPPDGPNPPGELIDLTQAIGGRVWYDDNDNGVQDPGEENAPDVQVELYDPSGDVGSQSIAMSTGRVSTLQTASIFAAGTATITTKTNSVGSFFFFNVPEGEWQVYVRAPSGYRFTYDSAGTSDGVAPTYVPPGGVGYMWAGLVKGAGLPDTGLSSLTPLWGGIAGSLMAVGLGLLAYRSWMDLRPAGVQRQGFEPINGKGQRSRRGRHRK